MRNNESEAYYNGEIFTAFDIETTGLDNRRDHIVEIGAVRFNKDGVIECFATLIDPGVPMPAAASQVNNITDKMLSGQPVIQEAMPAFLDFINGTIVLAHNVPFDCGFINNGLSRLYDDGYVPFPALPNRVIDTLPMARKLLPGKTHYNLQALSASLGFKAKAAHRAADDARLCMELFVYMVRTCFRQPV